MPHTQADVCSSALSLVGDFKDFKHQQPAKNGTGLYANSAFKASLPATVQQENQPSKGRLRVAILLIS